MNWPNWSWSKRGTSEGLDSSVATLDAVSLVFLSRLVFAVQHLQTPLVAIAGDERCTGVAKVRADEFVFHGDDRNAGRAADVRERGVAFVHLVVGGEEGADHGGVRGLREQTLIGNPRFLELLGDGVWLRKAYSPG